ncbi:unnamed protein product [Nippostrongylus brasiliensis]|uniref:DUF148 domain-containing protein n=1 Tax=Nippostrongylus brasiliensis TaxID=27835 RepID=A0A0N4Y6E5_NIPBR|nr:unnamed protein product [Nippostrongylus brasiliensis]
MRRRRGGWLHLMLMFPILTAAQSSYDAQPYERPPSRQPVPPGYQPPPSPMLFESPRSHPRYRNQYQNFPQQPQQLARNGYDDYRIVPHGDAQYENAASPQKQLRNQGSRRVIGPPSARPQHDLNASGDNQNPPDIINNIIVHIYLNAKERSSHAVATSGPIRGLFGIGTSHGGPGTHTHPVVITKDFDRDTLEFIEEKEAEMRVEEGPANIVEIKATVSSPDRKIENTLNKAVDKELDRAIPMVMNRMQGPMGTLDQELRKELEQALVDEIAKNLGDTIDNMGNVEDEDLGKLIEEGFNEIDKEFTSTTRGHATRNSSGTDDSKTVTENVQSHNYGSYYDNSSADNCHKNYPNLHNYKDDHSKHFFTGVYHEKYTWIISSHQGDDYDAMVDVNG